MAYPCGVTFERWITPMDAAEDLAALARCIDGKGANADARRASLYSALGFCQFAPAPDMPEIAAFKVGMPTWRGIGDVVVGMERRGFLLSSELAVRPSSVLSHPVLAADGYGTAPAPFEAV